MADQKISSLTAYASPVDTDVFPIVDTTVVETKKITWSSIKTALSSLFFQITNNLSDLDDVTIARTNLGLVAG